jgi:hypothetical protein
MKLFLLKDRTAQWEDGSTLLSPSGIFMVFNGCEQFKMYCSTKGIEWSLERFN